MKKNLMMEEIIKNYGAYIYDYAWKLTCHPQQAEDLAQETFIQAWKHMEQLKEEAALKKWLRTICYHQFLMNCRKKDEHLIYVEDMTLLEQEGDMLTAYENVPEEAVLVKDTVPENCIFASRYVWDDNAGSSRDAGGFKGSSKGAFIPCQNEFGFLFCGSL